MTDNVDIVAAAIGVAVVATGLVGREVMAAWGRAKASVEMRHWAEEEGWVKNHHRSAARPSRNREYIREFLGRRPL
jgi:hypothetical protein